MADITVSAPGSSTGVQASTMEPHTWRAMLAGAVAMTVAATLLATPSAETQLAVSQAGPELTTLLRFMAIVKAAMALTFVALMAWRFGYPATPRLAVAYVAAAALMSAAPVLIWQMVHVAAAAASFDAGLLLFAGAAWADGGIRTHLLPARGWRR